MISCSKCGNGGEWLQVQLDAGGKWGIRSFRLKGFNVEVTKGWRPIEKGEDVPHGRAVLCAVCKLALDEELTEHFFQHKDLQDSPLLFVPPDRVDLDSVVKEIKRIYNDGVVDVLESDRARAAKRVPLDSLKWLAAAARKAVKHKYGTLSRPVELYKHQAAAVTRMHAGGSIVLSTATSSGKSLCFQLPFLHDIAGTKDADQRPAVLYLAPLNALVDDQFRSLGEFGTVTRAVGPSRQFLQTVTFGGGSDSFVAAQYHGGVRIEDDDEQNHATAVLRREIRKAKPDFLFTNPEMLARAILPLAVDVTPPGCEPKSSGGEWQYLFERLRYVVLDECHEFRGVYGGHVANLIRRIKRLCACVGNKTPLQFVLCSATIREPGRFAEAITGTKPTLVIDRHRDTSERFPKKLVFLRRRDPNQPMREFAKGALGLVFQGQRLSTIAFQESIPGVQSLYREFAKKLKKDGMSDDCLRVFAATFLPTEKIESLANLRSGQVKGIISTSALALGIDIGSLSCAMLITYPGTMAKAWQMLGRAGRRGPGLQILLLGDSFLDRFWEDHPKEFIDQDKHLDELIVTPNNLRILEEHVIGANYDYPLDVTVDRRWFGPAFDEVLEAVQRPDGGYLTRKKEGGKEVFVFKDRNGQRLFEIALRGTSQFKVHVYLDKAGGTKIMEEDQLRALRSLHPGAVFIHNREFYEVAKLQYEDNLKRSGGRNRYFAVVRRVSDRETTVPIVDIQISALEGGHRDAVTGPIKVHFGAISVKTVVDQFFKVPYDAERPPPGEVVVAHGDDVADGGGGGGKRPQFKKCKVIRNATTPAEHRYETEATWLEVPPAAMADIEDDEEQVRALFTVGKALLQAIPRFHYSAPEDLSFTSYRSHPDTNDHGAIFIFERQAGGIGLAKRTFEQLDDLLQSALSEVLEGCRRCAADSSSRGCVSCVGDISGLHDRGLGIKLLHAWLDRSKTKTAKGGKDRINSGGKSKARPQSAMDALRSAGFNNPKAVGAGGMGKIYRAVKGGRVWALKMTTLGDVAREALEQKRLRDELQHPGFIHVEGIVRSGEWTFLQMEFADGGSLQERIGPAGYTPPSGRGLSRAAAIVREFLPIVEVVAGIHELGFVHRDIKPANILFVGDRPKLADYGILHQQAEIGEHTYGAGTPGYAPPSQLKTKAQPDVRDDVYALGAVLVEMLRGRRQPKQGAAVPPLPGVPPVLVGILRRALAPRQNDRQGSAAALLGQLREFVDAEARGKASKRSAANKTAGRKPR